MNTIRIIQSTFLVVLTVILMFSAPAAANDIVIGLRDGADRPFLLSMNIYPEWLLVKAQTAPAEASRTIVRTLLGLPVDSRSVAVEKEVLFAYRYWIGAIGAILLAFFIMGLYALNRSRQLARIRGDMLTDKNRELDFQRRALDEHAIVSTTDVKGDILFANDKFCNISGYSREELVGQNHRILKSKGHSPEFYENLWRTIANGKPWHGEIKNEKKGGGYYWVKATITPFLNAQGKPYQYVAIRTEITESKEAEKALRVSREQFAHAADVANLCHWRADNTMSQWLETSENTSQIIGAPAQELLGDYDKYLSRIHPEDLERVSNAYDAVMMEPQAYDLEYRVIGDDGVTRYLWEVGEPEYDETGTLLSYGGTTQDISIRKVAEQNAILAKEAADKANKAKSEFLSAMSHELRTPMNAILGFTQMLDYNPKEPLTKTQKTSVEYILTGGRHLLELIDQVLDLAKIESGSMGLSLEAVVLDDVCQECLSLIERQAGERSLSIECQTTAEAGTVEADYTRLKQVLLNLLSNAVKYNRHGGRILLGCQGVPDGMVRISVSDTGEGIAEGKRDGLFEPFNRLGKEAGEIEGTGIGLTITKQLIEAMAGRVGFESDVGKGSTFWVELPVARNVVAEPSASRENAKIPEQRERLPFDNTVLYVEDNPGNLLLMEAIIDRIDKMNLISAHNAELGIAMAEEHQPDIILMDINLPGMDGITATRVLAGKDITRNIPVVAVSAAAMTRDIEKGKAAGFEAYLTKPFNIQEVIETINRVLRKKAPPNT